jgi:hypothetical protein
MTKHRYRNWKKFRAAEMKENGKIALRKVFIH